MCPVGSSRRRYSWVSQNILRTLKLWTFCIYKIIIVHFDISVSKYNYQILNSPRIVEYSSREQVDCHHSAGHIGQLVSLKCRATLPAAFLFQIGTIVDCSPSLHSLVVFACHVASSLCWVTLRKIVISWGLYFSEPIRSHLVSQQKRRQLN